MLVGSAVRRVAIVGGVRIPFARAHGAYAKATNEDMLTAAFRGVVERFKLNGVRLGDAAAGAVIKHTKDYSLTRESVLAAGLDPHTPGVDLQRACGTSLEAAILIGNKIALGQIDSGLAGGTDSISDAPIVYPRSYQQLLLQSFRGRNAWQRIAPFLSLRPRHFKPVLPAVVEPRTGLSMGQSTELMANRWKVTREDQDQLAYESHMKATAAWRDGFYSDLVVEYAGLKMDNNIRQDTTLEKLAKRLYGDVIPTHQADKRLLVLRQPIGVVAAVTPWNFPAAMITRKAGPALAAGCTFVCKPAHQTPYSALAMAELGRRAGLPAGVLNVVTGVKAAPIGEEMTSNPLVRKITFTGSTAVGKKLMAQSAGTLKKLSLELGGNAPFIVFDDADLDAAVAGAITSKYRNTGQTCVCANRLLVQSSVYETFTRKLVDAVAQLRVGDGLKGVTDQGPLIDAKALAKVEEHVADALSKGGRVAHGGKRHALGGTFFQPTVITNVTSDMLVAREETFGPVAPLFRFETEAEAIRMANDTEFGLASYFYTRDLARSWRVSEALEYGIVGLNTGLISTEVAPFGGVKESGIGREGSRYGILDYTELKYVCVGGIV